ncbi:MAG: sulfite exporter TauE/SafE family protein [Planctomycetes bacterium]|nr:sulfite exporter TauE/SafE family protein [Planctomycetota bacterium]
MELLVAVLIVVTGLVMGFVNNLAGAGGALALLTFELVAQLSPEAANAAMRPAALAIAIGGWLGFRRQGQGLPVGALRYGLLTVPGAVLGTWLAIRVPPAVYDLALLVVIAILVASLLRNRGIEVDATPASPRGAYPLFALIGVHMGFLHVGVGLLSIVALRRVGDRDLVRVNAAKMALLACSSATSIVAFSAARAILWGPALLLAVGAFAGSYLGAVWSVRRGHRAVLVFVVVIASIMLARAAFRLALSIGAA